MTSLKKMVSPLKNARQLGSAKDGTGHWWAQRLSAIALLFLLSWLVYTLVNYPPASAVEVAILLKNPLNAFLLSLIAFALFYHGTLGIQVVIEDYIHAPFAKYFLLIGFKLAAVVAVAGTLFTIITFYLKA